MLLFREMQRTLRDTVLTKMVDRAETLTARLASTTRALEGVAADVDVEACVQEAIANMGGYVKKI